MREDNLNLREGTPGRQAIFWQIGETEKALGRSRNFDVLQMTLKEMAIRIQQKQAKRAPGRGGCND
jgi:CHAD domain-containing protein